MITKYCAISFVDKRRHRIEISLIDYDDEVDYDDEIGYGDEIHYERVC